MQRIFISYSRKDGDFVTKLTADLEKAGFDVWRDLDDIRGGDNWTRSIPTAIESSQFVLVVISPNSVISKWVESEITEARNQDKKIIPVMLESTRMPFALNTINFVNFTSGSYTENYRKLLDALGHSGEVPAVTTFINKRLKQSPALRKYALPIGGAVILVAAFIAYLSSRNGGNVPPPPASTSTAAALATATPTPEPVTATISTTVSAPPTFTPTKPTPTFTSTLPPEFSLPICIYSYDGPPVNIRTGPDTDYDELGKLEQDGSNCPFFSAYIRNSDQETWFQFASNQAPGFDKFANGWISADVLAALDRRWLPLPLCIYTPAGTVNVYNLPGLQEEKVGAPITGDGTHCPFFTTRKQTADESIWYQFAPSQRDKKEFQQYAGGWIPEDSLVVRTLILPVVTLSPTPVIIPSLTPSSTPTSSRTPTITPSNTPTPTDTDTPVPSDTPTP